MAELMYRLGHSTPAMAMRYQHSRLERDRDLGRRLSARCAAVGYLTSQLAALCLRPVFEA
jgi:hypothetical protein